MVKKDIKDLVEKIKRENEIEKLEIKSQTKEKLMSISAQLGKDDKEVNEVAKNQNIDLFGPRPGVEDKTVKDKTVKDKSSDDDS